MSSEFKKRTLIVAGNCHARCIYRALTESPELNERYQLVYFRNFRKGDQGVLSDEDLRDCAVLLEQIAHKAPELPGKERLPADCQVIRFPILWMNSLWPTHVKDPRNVATPEHPQGLYPYGDRLILRLLEEGHSPEEAARRYLETDLAQEYDLERFHEINVAKSRSLDKRAELKLGAHVLDNFTRSRLFVTHNHPTLPMLRRIVDTVFDALGVAPPPSDLIAASGGLDQVHMPVHPKVAEYFKLEWYDPQLEYKHYGAAYRIDEFMRRYAAFT